MSGNSEKPIMNERDLNARVDQLATAFVNGTLQFKYQPTGSEKIVPVLSMMDPIPPGANPFNHDMMSMGTDLTRGWIVMHPGFDNKEEPMGMPWLYLVNTRSGERFRIELNHIPEAEELLRQQKRWDSYKD